MSIGYLIDDFGFKILSITLQEDKYNNNFVCSSPSIYLVMAMVLVGAKEKTADELRRLLGIDFSSLLSEEESNKIKEGINPNSIREELMKLITISLKTSKISSKIFSATDILKNYAFIVQSVFRTEIDKISFNNVEEACGIINEWVKMKTEGKIEKILKPDDISSSTSYVIANTIFFKSKWEFPFLPNDTVQEDFHVSKTETVKVMMMYGEERYLYWDSDEINYTILMIRFERQNSYGVFILPKENKTIGDILVDLKAQHIRKWFEEAWFENVKVKIPRIKLSKLSSIRTLLEKLGATEVFDINRANLTGISSERTYLSNVIHSANIELDEFGVVASAATAAVACYCCAAEPRIITFYANKPFIFLVYDNEAKFAQFVTYIRNPNL